MFAQRKRHSAKMPHLLVFSSPPPLPFLPPPPPPLRDSVLHLPTDIHSLFVVNQHSFTTMQLCSGSVPHGTWHVLYLARDVPGTHSFTLTAPFNGGMRS